jgi:nucleotide-binding universal stress UspA family protein
VKRIPRILLAIDGSERSFAASVYLGKVLSKQAEIVLFHVMAEAPEAFRDVSADLLTEKENYPLSVWKTCQEETIHEFMTIACDILIASGFPKEAISVKTQILRSGVARDILNESHQNYDMLVVGRTGISKIENITLGSVASKLVDVVAHPPIIVVINEAKRHLKEAGLSEEQISSEILIYQKSRAAAIVKTASKGGYDTIVLGRRGLTAVGEFQIGRVSRKILQFAYQSTVWIVS